MRVLLLCSAFNGLSQRAWIELRELGHDVHVQLAVGDQAIVDAVAELDPDLVICPFLKERVPAEVWTRRRTIIIHPGPVGDRGPSSLDWAITEGVRVWGVTALQAVEEMDAGPVWGSRTFLLGADPARKGSLYNGAVADAAIELIREVLVHAADPAFVPRPASEPSANAYGRARPLMRQSDREFAWSDPTDHVLRRIRAADGSPGVRTVLCGVPVSVFDAQRGSGTAGEPGRIVARRHGAVLVRTGDGAVWVGYARRIEHGGERGVKLPAVAALGHALGDVPELLAPLDDCGPGYREITYRQHGDVGVVSFDVYNGAMSTAQCRRLAAALRHAATRDTEVLVLFGGDVFSNGIHLNVIEEAANPAVEAWRNINAINDVCRELIECPQPVVAAIGGNAGAGGVMLALGADRVLVRDGVVLNPHYRTMGLFGSEYWTYVLPRRVGVRAAEQLTERALPIGASEAVRIGLADEVFAVPRREFEAAAIDAAARLACRADGAAARAAKAAARQSDEQRRPLLAYRVEELAEMSQDIFDDRNGFAAARRAFVLKQPQAREHTDASRGWRRLLASTKLPGCAPQATSQVTAPVTAGPDRAVRDAAAGVGGT